jgi:FkbM family methyltransferase
VNCDVLGFEPNAAECDKLNQLKKTGHTYLPYFIADGFRHTFYDCNYPMTSSLFEPNTALLAKFNNLEELTRVVTTYPVETKRLDEIPEAKGTPYLKIDTQGSEVMVLQGAAETLASVLVVHTEVLFVPLYKDQPMFADINALLRSRGFVLNQMMPSGRTFKPLVWRGNVDAMMSHLLWADAVYVRDFMMFDRLEPEQLLTLTTILHQTYGACDLAQVALAAYDRRMGTQLQRSYNAELLKMNMGVSLNE